MSYTVLVVDPPWSYGSDTGRTRTAEHHYETLGNAGKEINRKSGAGKAESDSCADSAEVKAEQFVGADAEGLSVEESSRAIERTHCAVERHLHAWTVTGIERHLEFAKASH